MSSEAAYICIHFTAQAELWKNTENR